MAESEVETILREIRERVLSQQQLAGNDVAASAADHITNGNEGNGVSEFSTGRDVARQESKITAAENLALINSYLTTTARAWDRLPPLVSNRSGLTASVELWVKRKLKRATRWYAWEQVNFNAAVHHAIRDMLPVLAAYEQELEKLRASIDAEKELRQVEFAKHQAEITARLLELSSEFRAELSKLRAELEAQQAAAEAQRQAVEAKQRETEAQRAELSSTLAKVVSELREGDERLQAEHRVSFKQLSLEASEAAVLEDRARRKTEALLEELTRRVDQLERE